MKLKIDPYQYDTKHERKRPFMNHHHIWTHTQKKFFQKIT